jgi:phytanoyl-CoA hydroxylase
MQCTFDDNLLKSQFAEQGFVALPKLFSGEALDELQAHVERFLCDVLPTLPDQHVFCEVAHDRQTLKQIQHMEQYDKWFCELATAGPLRELAEILLAGPVVHKNLQYFNKPPAVGQPTPAHQDGFYFMLEPCEALTMWLALDVVDEENGCVRYVPGSHRNGMRMHSRTTTLGFSQGIADYPTADDAAGERPMPAVPGDLLAHHALTIHRADRNMSTTRSRRALGLIYYSTRAHEDTAAHAAYQQQLADEMRPQSKI